MATTTTRSASEPSITLRELRKELIRVARWIKGAPELPRCTFREGQQDGLDLVRNRIIEPREKAARKCRPR